MPDWVTVTVLEWLDATFVDVGRYVIFAVGVWLVLWVGLRGVMAGRKIRGPTPPPRQLVVEFFVSIRSITIFSTVGLAMFGLESVGLLPGPRLAAAWGGLWFGISLILMVVAHDAYFYWTHRLMHDPRLFRRMHLRHHRSHNPSPFTAYSFDLLEAAVNALFVPIWMVLVPTDWPVLGLFMLHQIARNTVGHGGYELMPARRDGRPLFDWVTSVTHHDLHHAQGRWNYGLYFTWWDRLCRTEHPEYHARFAEAVSKRKPAPSPAAASSTSAAAAALLAVTLLAWPQDARAQNAAEIAGDWATPGLGAIVRLQPCASQVGRLCGDLTWAGDSSEIKPSSVGKAMLWDFQFRDGRWRDGSLRNPADGQIYKGEIWLEGDILRLKGCAGIFCQSQAWRRLISIPRPAD